MTSPSRSHAARNRAVVKLDNGDLAVLVGVRGGERGGERKARILYPARRRLRTVPWSRVAEVLRAEPYGLLEEWYRLRYYLLLLAERSLGGSAPEVAVHFPLRSGRCAGCPEEWPCGAIMAVAGDFVFSGIDKLPG